jgi:hypothetical protein
MDITDYKHNTILCSGTVPTEVKLLARAMMTVMRMINNMSTAHYVHQDHDPFAYTV